MSRDEAVSGIISAFKFHSYKIDDFSFKMDKQLNLLNFKGVFSEKDWVIDYALVPPTFFKSNNMYHSGIRCRIRLSSSDSTEGSDKTAKKDLIFLESTISGLFSFDNSEIDTKTVEQIIKHQFPAILFPYLRSAVTSFFANAGFGTFIFPLINVAHLAETTLKDIDIKLVD